MSYVWNTCDLIIEKIANFYPLFNINISNDCQINTMDNLPDSREVAEQRLFLKLISINNLANELKTHYINAERSGIEFAFFRGFTRRLRIEFPYCAPRICGFPRSRRAAGAAFDYPGTSDI